MLYSFWIAFTFQYLLGKLNSDRLNYFRPGIVQWLIGRSFIFQRLANFFSKNLYSWPDACHTQYELPSDCNRTRAFVSRICWQIIFSANLVVFRAATATAFSTATMELQLVFNICIATATPMELQIRELLSELHWNQQTSYISANWENRKHCILRRQENT